MKLSKKKEYALWNIVHNSVMDMRIKIARLEPNNKLLCKVDDIVYLLDAELSTKLITLLTNK